MLLAIGTKTTMTMMARMVMGEDGDDNGNNQHEKEEKRRRHQGTKPSLNQSIDKKTQLDVEGGKRCLTV